MRAHWSSSVVVVVVVVDAAAAAECLMRLRELARRMADSNDAMAAADGE
jgi:hypothetical protein